MGVTRVYALIPGARLRSAVPSNGLTTAGDMAVTTRRGYKGGAGLAILLIDCKYPESYETCVEI
jgi:hypothetical protein